MGFPDRTRVPGEARLDARLRARRDHPARGGVRPVAQRRGSCPLQAAHRPAEGRSAAPGPVGGAPTSRYGRPRVRPGEAGPDARDPRPMRLCAQHLRQQCARQRQRRAAGRGWHARTARALDAAAARRHHPQLLLDDRARRRRRPHTAQHPGGARRRRVGDQRPQVVLVERVDQRHPHRDGEDRRLRDAVPQLLDDPRAHEDAGREHRARCAHHGRARSQDGRAGRPRRDHLRQRTRAVRPHRRR